MTTLLHDQHGSEGDNRYVFLQTSGDGLWLELQASDGASVGMPLDRDQATRLRDALSQWIGDAQ